MVPLDSVYRYDVMMSKYMHILPLCYWSNRCVLVVDCLSYGVYCVKGRVVRGCIDPLYVLRSVNIGGSGNSSADLDLFNRCVLVC